MNAELIKLKKYTHDEQKFKIENISKLKFEKNFQFKNINFKYNDGKKNIFEILIIKLRKEKYCNFRKIWLRQNNSYKYYLWFFRAN